MNITELDHHIISKMCRLLIKFSYYRVYDYFFHIFSGYHINDIQISI